MKEYTRETIKSELPFDYYYTVSLNLAHLFPNIRYYQMRIVQDQLHRYDNTNDDNNEIRKVLIKSVKINAKRFDEQDKKVNKLIMEL